MQYDVVIVGGGPAGLAAALVLGRARKRVLLCDAGTPRNERAEGVYGFVTRDGTPPQELRRIGREQLEKYPVEVRRAWVERVDGEAGAFRVRVEGEDVTARRVLLCGGMIDEVPDLEGYRDLWGRSIFQCPYCHGWEVQDERFAVLLSPHVPVEFAIFLRGWSKDVMVFTGGAELADDVRAKLAKARVAIEPRPVVRLIGGEALEAIELADGTRVARDVIFARPPQRHTDLVRSLDLTLDDLGFVRIDEQGETSRKGIHAAGDLTTMKQGALVGAAAGANAAYAMNHALTVESALAGELP